MFRREASEVEVVVECTEQVGGCPECGKRMHIHEWEKRRWRHLISCQFKTIIVSEVPRVAGADHGTQTVAVPWAERFGRFSRLFERLAIDVMQTCSVTAACDILGISWDEADGIKQRAVARGLERKKAQPIQRLAGWTRSVPAAARTTSRWWRGWIQALLGPKNLSATAANRKPWMPFGSKCPPSTFPRWRRSRWTCGSPASSSVQPSVRPIAPEGAPELTPGWTLEPRSGVVMKTQTSEIKHNQSSGA